jgi:hypothetical protein
MKVENLKRGSILLAIVANFGNLGEGFGRSQCEDWSMIYVRKTVSVSSFGPVYIL